MLWQADILFIKNVESEKGRVMDPHHCPALTTGLSISLRGPQSDEFFLVVQEHIV
jgi:hypothetical protein